MARLTKHSAEGLMPPVLASLRRRKAMGGLLGLAVSGLLPPSAARGQNTAPNAVTTNIFPDGATLTVAGPEGGEIDAWADALLPTLTRFLPTNPPLRRIMAGGLDGITGANQFAAQAQPDGTAALLAPGSALLAWLLGDPRVQADLGRYVPLLEGAYPLVLAGRLDPATLARGHKLRIGVSTPSGREMAAVLGLERLGLAPVPVPGLVDLTMTQAAFAQHTVDVMLLRGASIATTIAATSDARPICVLGLPDAYGAFARDPAMPDVPHLGELLDGMPDDQLTTGWRAAAIAAQQFFSLLLPALTPATMVGLWQRAVEQAATLPDITAMAAAQSLRLQRPANAMTADPAARAALRNWFSERRRG